MRRYDLKGDGPHPLVFDGERLASACGWQAAPRDLCDEYHFVMHLFRTALGHFVVTRELSRDGASTPARALVMSESIAEIVISLMDDNARVFGVEPFLGHLDRELFRLAGYAAPPAYIYELRRRRDRTRAQLVAAVRRLNVAWNRSDACAVRTHEAQCAALRRRLREAELAVEERSLAWLEASFGHDEEVRRARTRLATLRGALPDVTDDGLDCGRLSEERHAPV